MASFLQQIKRSEDYFSELNDTAEIRLAFMELVVQNASILYPSFKHDRVLADKLKKYLTLKTVDQNALYRGLFIQAVAIFEDFIRNMVNHIIECHKIKVKKYSKLNDVLQNYFIASSGNVLTHYGRGTVNGVKYNFEQLKLSLMSCFSDSDDYYIEPRVFTISMGNCTSSRVEKLFSKLCLDDDIFTSISGTTELKKTVMETRKSAVSLLIKEKLDRIIHIRNDIAHGELTVSISKDEFDDTSVFLRSLIKALAERCQSLQTQ
ncbi:MAE_28990/MAE_18760 family HEPN-like nuclease [Klebsiella pneumoniae]|uniref:MAE_28990/MAE_18760 family HEPN-like nuclease n=4 Tax=Klebsiella pneumoniae TaxID=573 RepID=UPI000E2BACA2|nr:MAE_28990/MAE_18760 family HEPN-like nuclease [Klebsiella pneumoniae]HDU4840508.1 hypothetical protein [Klebsiella pneumoniae subsp. pneumoniae]MBK2885102.1 hypothetical protein [Klebsiella pneumoniae]MBK2895616.1 hypothetical protein [Klebsiella pneumoniae]MBW5542302.1 hypothetical protein [Klebsiella pneumoniae]MCM6649427.1 MAE_28990/MAE_18760 family HEPN-like nuclease [Klebsiella pneumoniae]